jgi:hypothetical protein
MRELYNVYCDESCHLEHDGQDTMVLGAVWCAADKSREIAERLREIKQRHGLWTRLDVKWTKVSPARLAFYLDALDYFFDDDDLHFRALVAPKGALRHEAFGQTHDQWYYQMYFELLKQLIRPGQRYRIYLDVKDTQGADKVAKLHDVLCNNHLDFDRHVIERVQQVRSHEVEQLQLADLLAGAVGYANRRLDRRPEGSDAKQALLARMRKRSGYSLTQSTLLREEKVNVFRWSPREVVG